MPSDAEIAADILLEESTLRFASFRSEDAVTIGMNLRKRFRASLKYSKGRGAVVAIKTLQGATLFACAVGDGSDVSFDSWIRLEAIMKVAARTSHSSLYVEKGKNVLAKTGDEMGLPFPEYRIEGGAFPIWLAGSTLATLKTIIPWLCRHYDISLQNKQMRERALATLAPAYNIKGLGDGLDAGV